MAKKPIEPLRHIAFVPHKAHLACSNALPQLGRKIRDILTYVSTFENIKTVTLWADPLLVDTGNLSDNDKMMSALANYLVHTRNFFVKNNIKVSFVGIRANLSVVLQEAMSLLEEETRRNNGGICLQLGLAYKGREQIMEATTAIVKLVLEGKLSPDQISEERIGKNLSDHADPDLIVVLDGQRSLQGFLPWGASYAEWYQVSYGLLDLDMKRIAEAVQYYAERDRRKGGV